MSTLRAEQLLKRYRRRDVVRNGYLPGRLVTAAAGDVAVKANA